MRITPFVRLWSTTNIHESCLLEGWIYKWIVAKHSPNEFYRKKNVLPGAIISKHKKPGFIKSFLYLGFHHLSTLQHKGLTIWDALENKTFISRPFLFLSCGDGPGLLCTSNFVRHLEKHGYYTYCSLHGHRTHSTRHANSSLDFIIFVSHYSMVCFQMNTGMHNFCKFVAAIHVMSQYRINPADL